ncbi:MAG: hypothetical protein IPH93_16735 [Saprospiraceae bacterium]|nr:hypothetical protein [Saprospiraceae bacterium]MBK9631417.1 hypothetical protein [Saprospiraceae bacterium]
MFLFATPNLIAAPIKDDSLFALVEELELNIQKLNIDLSFHFDQLDYLKEELGDLANRQDLKETNELIESKQNDIAVLKYRIQLYSILLSKARRIEYYPLQQRQKLVKEIVDESVDLNKRKILISEVKASKLSERMSIELFPAEFPYDCQTEYFPANQLSSTKSESLFSYTPEEIEGSLNASDFLNAKVSILQGSKNVYLDLRLLFNTAKAAKIYGLLEASQSVKLEFMDGSFIYLNASHSSTGEVNSSLNQCLYHLQFPLDDFRLKELRNKHADKLTVIWEKGKEIFEIYQIDIIQKLIKCQNP